MHLLPETNSSRDELEEKSRCYGGDVGVYMCTRLTWTIVISKAKVARGRDLL